MKCSCSFLTHQIVYYHVAATSASSSPLQSLSPAPVLPALPTPLPVRAVLASPAADAAATIEAAAPTCGGVCLVICSNSTIMSRVSHSGIHHEAATVSDCANNRL
eukprot:TRINITY_DN1491_c0_g1_i9.p2 TRINITY_DN1491_c0_g1~~TRINITY_DN1491_c0_g1_i9.p2  ORF type:complete len:105 (+),score=5.60 TRINITY_DN1491_c0_g1_i9:363-677(+)